MDIKAWTTGLAYELVSDRGVNSTSALENGETSAIGRALANANYAAKGKRASREEMSKVAVSADLWANDKKQPVLLGDGVELVSGVFNPPQAPVAPMCAHGAMTIRQGNSAKTGRDYLGFICNRMDKTEQCQPIWYNKNADGVWTKP